MAVIVQALSDRPGAAFGVMAAVALLACSRSPEGSRPPAANTSGMSETDHRTEPHVSTEELRAALAPRGETRRNPVLVTEQAEHAEGEIASLRDALDAARADETELRTELDLQPPRDRLRARADAIELRAALDAARGDAAELRAELATAKADLRERRNALETPGERGRLQAPQG